MFLKEFFYFRRTDRAIVCLLAAVACIILAVVLCIDGSVTSSNAVPDTHGGAAAAADGTGAVGKVEDMSAAPAVRLFRFDPNTADSATLLRLGLQPWVVRNICRYRRRGGTYSRAEDFARTYGLTVRQYRELKPYISIAEDFLPASVLVDGRHEQTGRAVAEHRPDTAHHAYKLRRGETVALNTADTAALQRVPGIGSYFSRQIVTRRTMLGGFCSVRQLAEIDGFPLSALPYFTADAGRVKRLNLNRLTLAQMRRHPYINFYQARAIADYRRLHGPLEGLQTLRQLSEFSPSDINRLAPYVEF